MLLSATDGGSSKRRICIPECYCSVTRSVSLRRAEHIMVERSEYSIRVVFHLEVVRLQSLRQLLLAVMPDNWAGNVLRAPVLRCLIQKGHPILAFPDLLYARRDNGVGIFRMAKLQVHAAADKVPLQHGASPGRSCDGNQGRLWTISGMTRNQGLASSKHDCGIAAVLSLNQEHAMQL